MKKLIKSFILAALTTAAFTSCTKVDVAPLQIELGAVDYELLGVNDCDTGDAIYWSSFRLLVPVANLDKVLVDQLTLTVLGADEPFETQDFEFVDGQISLHLCFLFQDASSLDNEIFLSGTNRVGEKIDSNTQSFTLDRPFGAN